MARPWANPSATPSFGLLALLGVVLAAHGIVRALSLHGAVITIAWIAVLVAARPILLRYWRRLDHRDLRAGARLLAAYALAGAAGAALALAGGADPLVAAIAAATALRAHLAGMPAVALAALAAAWPPTCSCAATSRSEPASSCSAGP